MLESLLATGRALGFHPNALMLWDRHEAFDRQARCLLAPLLIDAYDRGIAGIDWQEACDALMAQVQGEGERYLRDGIQHPLSHSLDLAYACHCVSRLATTLGRGEAARRFASFAGNWRNAFDPKTGLLRPSTYYEADFVHYSFRLLHDMAGRIDLAGGRARFVELLDRFFGFGAAPVRQLADPPWDNARAAGMALGRFDGTNNEVAIETPYAYLYAGRHDRTVDVIRGVTGFHYAATPGGLPGNDDSGALSSWYVWAVLGLMPVPGQGIFLLGSPHLSACEITLGERRFCVDAPGARADRPYVSSATLNGRDLDRAFLSYDEVLRGGTLRLRMTDRPTAFGRKQVPPSISAHSGSGR